MKKKTNNSEINLCILHNTAYHECVRKCGNALFFFICKSTRQKSDQKNQRHITNSLDRRRQQYRKENKKKKWKENEERRLKEKKVYIVAAAQAKNDGGFNNNTIILHKLNATK